MTDLLTDTAKPHHAPNVLVDSEDDTMMLLAEGSSHAYILNQSSQLIWQLSDGKTSIAEIIALLENAFSEDAEAIREDVLAAIDGLRLNGLLVLR